MRILTKTQLFTLFTVILMVDLTGVMFAAHNKSWWLLVISALLIPGDLVILRTIYDLK